MMIYGIWALDRQHWLVNGDGVIFHTPHLEVAMAQLGVVAGQLGVPGNWFVVKIGTDGFPDKEAMRKLGFPEKPLEVGSTI